MNTVRLTQVEEKNKKCDVSDLFESFGKYQIIQYILIFVPELIIGMISINYVFTVHDVDYRCHIDECEEANSTAQFPSWWPNTNRDKCSMPMLKSGEDVCTNSSFTRELVACSHWIYQSNDSVITELNLACQPWKSNLIGAIHNMGMVVSTIVFGWTSDKIGRKPVLIFCGVGGSIGLFKTFTTSYYVYVIVEFLVASITGGFYSVALVIFMEITGKKYRVLSGVIFSYAFYLAEIILACIAMLVPYWKALTWIISSPCIFFVALSFLINESPKWQIVSGKIEEAKKIMVYIAKVNKININNEELINLNEAKLKEKFEIENHEVKESLLNAFKSKVIIKRFLVTIVCRFTSTLVYYGIMINSVALPGNKQVNFILSSLMSIPGELLCLYLMNKFGRKMPVMIAFISCGVFCIISAFIPAKYLWIKLTVFMISKVIIAGGFTGSTSYTLELFPTSVRGSMVGLGFFASRIGGILAPLTPILITISDVLPFVLFGCTAIIAGMLLILTPETKDLPLFDTIKQVENHAYGISATGNDEVATKHSMETVASVLSDDISHI